MDDLMINSNTQKKLQEIETELELLRIKEIELKSHWYKEKNLIQSIRNIKSDIENLKLQAEKYERESNLAKVAEIRYGQIPDLEKKLKDANDELKNVQVDGKMLKEEVDPEDIAEIISKWTGIPLSKMLESEKIKLLKMEDRLKERIISQSDAIVAVSNSLRRSKAGIQDENRPIGSFIFLGTTGVGKTEMAKALAEFLFDSDSSIIRIDMSEYMEKFSVSRLIGAPPGYVGYDEGGQLTEPVRNKPYSVILLDEIEKAHPDIFNILLQILDDGRLTDSKGRIVNFKNTIIIMTSNIGTELIQEKLNSINEHNKNDLMNELKFSIINLLKKKMKPEFLNRIDEIVMFQPLTNKDIENITELQIRQLQSKMLKKSITLSVTKSAIEWLANIGFDIHYGARPLKRAIQKYILDALSVKILSGELKSGDKIKIDCNDNGQFLFNIE